MRRVIIAGNWKMNKTVSDAVSLVKELKELVKDVKDIEVVVCPPFIALNNIAEEIKGSNVKLGAQNAYFEKEGAFTGEVSCSMLKDVDVDYVIIGHSERRHVLGETDDVINKKIKAALDAKLKPIFCVGELLEEREANKTNEVIEKQIKEGLKDVKDNVVIAYEPVWAIGTGKTATPEQAEEVHLFIRDLLKKIYDDRVAEETSILYGGSVKPSNIQGLMDKANIDGALVGGASLKAKDFSDIVKW
ncbi:MAG: triose-phosphate isomerase [Nanoarchaeota archaeon]|nr:triose-phosphate isomerase [Nanoarchaeota archaeon]